MIFSKVQPDFCAPMTIGFMPRRLRRGSTESLAKAAGSPSFFWRSVAKAAKLADQSLVMAGTLVGKDAAGWLESPDPLARAG